MPVVILLLVLNTKKIITNHKKPVKCVCFGSSAEFYHKSYHSETGIYSKLPTETGQGIIIKSEDSLFRPHQGFCQAYGPKLVAVILVTLTSKK